MGKKRNIIVGQSGGPTSVINSSLAGVYKTAKERGFHKVYGMLHGIEGLLDEMYVDLSTQIHSDMDIELLKRTPSAFLGDVDKRQVLYSYQLQRLYRGRDKKGPPPDRRKYSKGRQGNWPGFPHHEPR